MYEAVKVKIYCDASVLNGLSKPEDMHTFESKTVPHFDDHIDVGGTDASGFFSATCAILATKNMKKSRLCELLVDTSLFNTKSAQSLIYVNAGSKVCVCVCAIRPDQRIQASGHCSWPLQQIMLGVGHPCSNINVRVIHLYKQQARRQTPSSRETNVHANSL